MYYDNLLITNILTNYITFRRFILKAYNIRKNREDKVYTLKNTTIEAKILTIYILLQKIPPNLITFERREKTSLHIRGKNSSPSSFFFNRFLCSLEVFVQENVPMAIPSDEELSVFVILDSVNITGRSV